MPTNTKTKVKHLQARTDGTNAVSVRIDATTAREIEFIQSFLGMGLQLKPSLSVLFRRAVYAYKLELMKEFANVYGRKTDEERLKGLSSYLEGERQNLEIMTGR